LNYISNSLFKSLLRMESNILSTVDKLNNETKSLRDELFTKTKLLRDKSYNDIKLLNDKCDDEVKSLNDKYDSDVESIQKREKIVRNHINLILLQLPNPLKDKFCSLCYENIADYDEPGIKISFKLKSPNLSPPRKRRKMNSSEQADSDLDDPQLIKTEIHLILFLSEIQVASVHETGYGPYELFKPDNHTEIIGYLRNQLKALAGDCN